MANNSANVTTGAPNTALGGYIYFAPAGTALPTDASTALSNEYLVGGFISEDGFKDSFDTSVTKFNDWGGRLILTSKDSNSEQFSLTFVEQNETVWKIVFGNDNVTKADGVIKIKHAGASEEEHVMVIEELMANGQKRRTIVPRAKLAELGDISHTKSDLLGYECTFDALLDSTENANAIEYVAVAAE